VNQFEISDYEHYFHDSAESMKFNHKVITGFLYERIVNCS